jgi:hypothetical protein
MARKFKMTAFVIPLIFVVVGGLGLSFVPSLIEKSLNNVLKHSPDQISQAALDKHRELIIMDWHSDSLLWNRNLLKRSNYGHMDIPRLREGNVAIPVSTGCARASATFPMSA